MYLTADTLDDLMHDVLSKLTKLPFDISTSRGKSSEIFGVLLKLNNPLARLSMTESKGKPFSALGELLWYLSKTNDLSFIEYYISKYRENSDDGNTIHGGYGPRLFNMHGEINQVETVIELLKERPNTRRAVIQIVDAKDLKKQYKDIPCTCTLQFAIREKKLNMFTSMRSNDAFIGLPHDIFCFTMLQEIIARSVGVELGTYNHSVGSLHLYEEQLKQSEEYLAEGYQSTKISMNSMPTGDPWTSIATLLKTENDIRNSIPVEISKIAMDSYWLDLVLLLQIHQHFKAHQLDDITELQTNITNQIYNIYIEQKKLKKQK